MDSERWQQIDQLFHSALERDGGERTAFLAQACVGDERLRQEVESLLASHDQAASFMEMPAADAAAGLLAERHARLKPGTMVNRYKILDLLGEGGMGEVYLAQDMTLGRKVALKLLSTYLSSDGDRLRRFEQEARAASALSHANVCVVHEVGEAEGGRHYIVMEYLEGVTLRERMADSRMKISEVLDTAVQVASALTAAHKAGIVHRDIKPENVILRPDGNLKVLDFGLAKLTERPAFTADSEVATRAQVKTNPGMVMGTVQYMSPEQARGKEVDTRSDIWSFGVVLYEMVTGRVPFEGETSSHVIVSLMENEPPPLTRYTEVPAELVRIITKSLRKKKEERYQTASDLALDLKSLKQELEVDARLKRSFEPDVSGRETTTKSDGQTVHASATRTADVGTAHPTSSAEYLVSEIRRHKRAAVLVLATLLIAAATALVTLWAINKPKLPALDASLKTIAVLPFKPLAAESRNESLELGMTDTLINKLSGISQLVVRPLSDVRKYTKLEQDPIAAGRELGVDYVLEGNLQMVGVKTRATVRLLSVKDGRAIWTDKCDQECSTVFELQDAFAERIAGTLARQLTGEEKKQLAKHYTENPEAYRLYSLGVAETDMKKKVEYFEQAIKIDPNYALAYVGIFAAYYSPGTRGFPISEEERLKSEWAAMKAVELDDLLPRAHTALGHIRKSYWDWAGADKEFKRGVELDANSYEANLYYSVFLVDVGRPDEALLYAKRADEVKPNNPDHLRGAEAYVYYHKRQYDKAIELWLMGKKSNEPLGNVRLAEAYLAKGMYAEGVAEMQKAVAFNKEPERWDGYPILAYAYALAGRRDEALKILEEQQRLAKQGYITPYNFAIIYTGLGDKDRAFEYLNKAYEEHAQPMYHFPSRPMFDSLHSDPRYAALLRKMNLTP